MCVDLKFLLYLQKNLRIIYQNYASFWQRIPALTFISYLELCYYHHSE